MSPITKEEFDRVVAAITNGTFKDYSTKYAQELLANEATIRSGVDVKRLTVCTTLLSLLDPIPLHMVVNSVEKIEPEDLDSFEFDVTKSKKEEISANAIEKVVKKTTLKKKNKKK